MTVQQDLYFRYHAFNTASFCHVRVLQGEADTVVICSEPMENSGPSVTNTAAILIPLLREFLEEQQILNRTEEVVWVEHCDRDTVYRQGHLIRHTYAEVWLGDAGAPSWCHLADSPAFLAERFNYPEECFEIPETSLQVGLATVVDLPIARPR